VVVKMRRRTPWAVLLVAGLLFMIGSAVMSFAVAPRMTMLPGDTNTTRTYTGTAQTLANPAWLLGNRMVPAVLHDVPVTIVHQTKVLKTDGDAALVSDHRLLTVPMGYTVADLTNRYGVDRNNLGPAGGFSDVTAQRGLTFNWPIGTNKHDYTGWVSDTGRTTTLHYTGVAKKAGVTTYVFTATIAPTQITDQQLLARLPSSISKADIMSMVPSLGFTTKQLTDMAKTLGNLPDPVPLTYTYAASNTYWVAPETGVVVDIRYHETRSVAFSVGPVVIPVSAVMDMTYTSTPHTLAAAAKDAKDGAAGIQLIRTTLPLILLFTGLAFTLVSIAVLAWRRPGPPTTPAEPIEVRTPAMVG
jgi:hypothetical protein